jgi:hypothetical protein
MHIELIGYPKGFEQRDGGQRISRRLPNSAARVRSPGKVIGMCGGHKGTGRSFPIVLRFPLPILIPPTAAHLLNTLLSILCSLDTDSIIK